MNWNRAIFVLGLIWLTTWPLFSQHQDSTLLTLERIYSAREFFPDRFGPARWLEDGSGYTTLERSEEKTGGRDIVRYNPESGDREILVSARLLVPEGDSTALPIRSYEWSPDNKNLLIFTNTRRVWRRHTRGDYWVLNLENQQLYKLGGDAQEASLMFATFSPDSRMAAYVSGNNLYVEDLATHKIRPLTSDGSTNIINGTFDWVYEEELSLRHGFRWSPDSRRIAYWQLDAEGVGRFYMINNTDSIYSRIIPVQYPKVGTTNSAARIGIVSVEGGETTWLQIPGDPRNHYLARMDWAASSDQVVVQQLNRLQNTNRIMLGNAADGSVETIFTDRDSAWLDVYDDLHWLDEGKWFTWVSERDGWRHIYRISRDGKKIKLLTKGEYDITEVVHLDEAGGWVYFMASPDNATQRYLFRVRLSGKGKAERITPKDQPGWHRYNISPDGHRAFHYYSRFDTPTITELLQLPEHRTQRVLVENERLKQKVAELKRGKTEFFQVDIGNDIKLDAWMMLPPDFDPQQKYPVLFYVYGEPAGQTVVDRWSSYRYFWHLYLTQQGYIVASVDNRGTPGPRGREWRKCVYRQIGILASADQAAAVKTLLAKRPYLDPARVGIWGWSGGGSMSLNAIFRYPDLYKTAISVAPVSDQRCYDTIYQERYMGLPKDNPDGYKNGSPVTFAHQLKGNLLLIHGTGDDNVHYQNSERLINELIRHNKPFSMMAYPNRSHGIYEGHNTIRHLYELMNRYLRDNLPPGGKVTKGISAVK